MNRISVLCFAVLATTSFAVAGCGEFASKPAPQPKQSAQEQKPAVLLDRYELHEIRNGSFTGTALLDKQTGRVWTLGSTSKNGHVVSLGFDEAPIFPRPEPIQHVSGQRAWAPLDFLPDDDYTDADIQAGVKQYGMTYEQVEAAFKANGWTRAEVGEPDGYGRTPNPDKFMEHRRKQAAKGQR